MEYHDLLALILDLARISAQAPEEYDHAFIGVNNCISRSFKRCLVSELANKVATVISKYSFHPARLLRRSLSPPP